MTAVLLAPVILSMVVLAAHFLRVGQVFAVALLLGLIPLLGIRARWVARVFQVVLVLGAAEWVRTLVALRGARVGFGQPAGRMTVILATVAAVTALSALLFQLPRLRRRYRLGGRRGDSHA